MAVLANISPAQRALVAAVLTAIVVAPIETVSFYKGEYLGWWFGVFVTPIAVALTFYNSMKARLLAWLLLSVLSILVVVAVIVGLWYV